MKKCFTKANVRTADWYTIDSDDHSVRIYDPIEGDQGLALSELPFPLVAKSHTGSRGRGNTLLQTQLDLEIWMRGKNLDNYIFEKYYNFDKEYRIHVTRFGCFYTCRKMLKKDAPEGNKWQRHDDNCVWILEENLKFKKPSNWDEIVTECVKALDSIGLDVAGFDVRVQSSRDENGLLRTNPDFIVIESNSACSLGEITAKKYIAELSRLLDYKYSTRRNG